MRLGDLIYQYRKKHKLSMDDFAKRSGLSKAYISLLEKKINPRSGKPIVPTYDTLQKAAKGMNLTIDELFKLIDQDFVIDPTETDLKDEFRFLLDEIMKLNTRSQERLLDYIGAMVKIEKEANDNESKTS
jgi:transcriptional regulator with XRE-family HTH domain